MNVILDSLEVKEGKWMIDTLTHDYYHSFRFGKM
jgi:hypothetical protein